MSYDNDVARLRAENRALRDAIARCVEAMEQPGKDTRDVLRDIVIAVQNAGRVLIAMSLRGEP